MNRSLEAEITRFNRLYKPFGEEGLTPFQTLQRLKLAGYMQVDIAKHFEVSQSLVSYWNKLFFPKVDGLTYTTREQ